MTDQELANALLRSGIVPLETIQQAGEMRGPDKNLAHALLDMGVSLEAIERLDPDAFQVTNDKTAGAQDAPRSLSEEYFEERLPASQDEGPTVRLVSAILDEGISQQASDIHLEPRADGLYLRYRIDGLLRPPHRLDGTMRNAIVSRVKILAGMDIAESRLPQDGRFRENVRGRIVDFRVSTLPTHFGEKLVLRILDRATVLTSLEELGMFPDTRKTFEDLILRPQGLVLVTGPTGSGKSTTLYAGLNRAKSETKNVVTVEDPIEYQLDGINQTTINPKIDLTFARQLRAILRQDPDVILVGEIRDKETADMAFRAALTGHLVLSTLHTNDAPSAMTRLVDMGIEPYLIASSVMAVLAQRLVRLNCEKCKEAYVPTDDEFLRLGMRREDDHDSLFMRGRGCDRCGKTGFRGRSGIYELMLINEDLRHALMSGKPASEIRRIAVVNGMRTLQSDGVLKTKQGLSTPEEVARVVFASTE